MVELLSKGSRAIVALSDTCPWCPGRAQARPGLVTTHLAVGVGKRRSAQRTRRTIRGQVGRGRSWLGVLTVEAEPTPLAFEPRTIVVCGTAPRPSIVPGNRRNAISSSSAPWACNEPHSLLKPVQSVVRSCRVRYAMTRSSSLRIAVFSGRVGVPGLSREHPVAPLPNVGLAHPPCRQ